MYISSKARIVYEILVCCYTVCVVVDGKLYVLSAYVAPETSVIYAAACSSITSFTFGSKQMCVCVVDSKKSIHYFTLRRGGTERGLGCCRFLAFDKLPDLDVASDGF